MENSHEYLQMLHNLDTRMYEIRDKYNLDFYIDFEDTYMTYDEVFNDTFSDFVLETHTILPKSLFNPKLNLEYNFSFSLHMTESYELFVVMDYGWVDPLGDSNPITLIDRPLPITINFNKTKLREFETLDTLSFSENYSPETLNFMLAYKCYLAHNSTLYCLDQLQYKFIVNNFDTITIRDYLDEFRLDEEDSYEFAHYFHKILKDVSTSISTAFSMLHIPEPEFGFEITYFYEWNRLKNNFMSFEESMNALLDELVARLDILVQTGSSVSDIYMML